MPSSEALTTAACGQPRLSYPNQGQQFRGDKKNKLETILPPKASAIWTFSLSFSIAIFNENEVFLSRKGRVRQWRICQFAGTTADYDFLDWWPDWNTINTGYLPPHCNLHRVRLTKFHGISIVYLLPAENRERDAFLPEQTLHVPTVFLQQEAKTKIQEKYHDF